MKTSPFKRFKSYPILTAVMLGILCLASESQAETCPNGGVFKCPVQIKCERQADYVRWDATVKTLNSIDIFNAAKAFAEHKCAFSVASIHTDLMTCTSSCE